MLLRSITKHVKDQNWFAVAIDFIIVVFGVFIGIQLGNWNEQLADNQRSQRYLQRISSDLSQDISIYNDRIKFWQQVSDYGVAVLDEANIDKISLSSWELVLAYFQASQTAEFFPTNATFEELKNAGDLELVRDEKLRNELSEYYSYPGLESLRERPRYREHIRSLLPLYIQKYIWLNCYQTDGGLQTLKDCPSPINQTEAKAIADQLKLNEKLQGELRYWISSLEVARLIVASNIQVAIEMRDEVRAQLDHKPTPL